MSGIIHVPSASLSFRPCFLWGRAVLLIVLLGISNSFNASGQDCDPKSLDSLRKVTVSTGVASEEAISVCYSLVRCYLDLDLDSAWIFSEKGMELARQINDKQGQATFQVQKGLVEEARGNMEMAKELFMEALVMYDDIEKDRSYYEACNILGISFENQGNYDMALQYYLLGMKEAEAQQDSMAMAYFYNNASVVYSVNGQHEKALGYMTKASDIFKILGHEFYYANSLVNIAYQYEKKGHSEKAKEYYLQAEIIQLDLENHYGLMNLYNGLGDIARTNEETETALDYYLKAFYRANQLDSLFPEKTYNIAISHKGLGHAYLLSGNYEKSIEHFQQARITGLKMSSLILLQESYSGLSRAYEALGQEDSAMVYLRLLLPVRDSMQAERYNERINKLDYEYELDKEKIIMAKEKELLVLSQQRKELIYLVIAGILFTLIIIAFFIGYWQRNKLRQSELRRKNIHLEKETLESDLEHKNRELSTTVLNLIERNEFIASISEKLKSDDINAENDQAETILSVIRKIDNSTSNKLWKEFEVSFMEVHRDFREKLTSRYPKLTSNERKLCAFILMNMSTKDISSITYQSPQSIKIARYRLRKKLGLERHENLNAFLHSLEQG